MTKTWLGMSGMLIAGAALVMAASKSDYDHETDFSKFHTYSWLRVKATDDLWKDRIEAAIEEQLTAKGWQKVETGGDATIAAYGATKEQHQSQTFYDGLGGGGYGWRRFGGFGGGGFGGDGIATTTQEDIPIGTLSVSIFDAQSKKMVWRADASDTLSSKPDKNEKKLEKEVSEMFKNFPPRSKG